MINERSFDFDELVGAKLVSIEFMDDEFVYILIIKDASLDI